MHFPTYIGYKNAIVLIVLVKKAQPVNPQSGTITEGLRGALKLERLPKFTDFSRIPSLIPPSLKAKVSGVLLQKPSFRMA